MLGAAYHKDSRYLYGLAAQIVISRQKECIRIAGTTV